jgi:hypothetical protein
MRARPSQLEPNRLVVLLSILGFVFGVWLSLNGLHTELVLTSAFGLGLVQLAEDDRRKVGARIREALRRADISLKEAAALMHMDQGDLTRALCGDMKLDLYRLEMLPLKFHQEWWPLQARDKGLPEQFHTWLKTLPVLFGSEQERKHA